MKNSLNILITLIFLFTALNLSAQDSIMQRHMRITDFSQVMLNGDFMVDIVLGDAPTVTIIAPEVDLKKVNVDMDQGSLIISLTEARASDSLIRVRIQARRIMKIKATGSIDIRTPERLNADALMIDLAGDASAILDVTSMRVSVRMDNSSSLVLSGGCAVLLGEMKGESDLNAFSVQVTRADLTMTDKSKARINVKDQIKARVTSEAVLEYQGNPELQTEGSREGGVRRVMPSN